LGKLEKSVPIIGVLQHHCVLVKVKAARSIEIAETHRIVDHIFNVLRHNLHPAVAQCGDQQVRKVHTAESQCRTPVENPK
jgi:hypothetical protein